MTAMAHFPTLRSGREHLKDVLDAAASGRPASISRDDVRIAAVDAARLVEFMAKVRPANAQLVPEAGGWSVFLPGLPIAADGATYDEALDEAVLALRDYADAWTERLRLAPNHANNWGLVQLVEAATDERLKAWLAGK
ncbi:putative RNase H-like HicB family nuclease [Arthrobacter sp. SORGH_AS 212]|uniref:type II toxin-antitoxin system HicB family antitoxin n=1 Tax=Pseudarthrobacter sp. SORGH_AS 212 TaxID=3041777 RepID=UPI00277D4D1F|nr:putative RNase H-like HicB family nuclease [Arthrobacter sp. SORGH_AS_0212]